MTELEDRIRKLELRFYMWAWVTILIAAGTLSLVFGLYARQASGIVDQVLYNLVLIPMYGLMVWAASRILRLMGNTPNVEAKILLEKERIRSSLESERAET